MVQRGTCEPHTAPSWVPSAALLASPRCCSTNAASQAWMQDHHSLLKRAEVKIRSDMDHCSALASNNTSYSPCNVLMRHATCNNFGSGAHMAWQTKGRA